MDGLQIRDERARAEQYRVDQLHITYNYCPRCGARIDAAGCWYGCGNPEIEKNEAEINAAILSVYDNEPACGNVREEEDAYYRHPD